MSGSRLGLGGAIAFAFGLRCIVAAAKGPVGTDEALYLVLGRNLWAGEGYTLLGAPHLIFPPLFPAILGALAKLVGSEPLASRIVFVLAGTALVPVVHAIARRAFGTSAARHAAWLTAASPALTVYVASWFWGSMSEPLFGLLAMGAWLAVMMAADATSRRGALAPAAAAGALAAASYLVRPEGVAYAALGVAVLLVTARATPSRRVLATVALVASFAVVAFPYLAYLHEHTGRWSMSGKSGRMLRMSFAMLGDDPMHRPEDLDVLAYEELGFTPQDDDSLAFYLEDEDMPEGTELTFVSLAREDPALLALHVGANLVDLATTLPRRSVHPLPLLVLALVGFGAALRRGGPDRRGALLVALAAAPVGAFALFGILPRFLVIAVPPLIVGTGAGIEGVARAWSRRRGGDPARVAGRCTAVLVALLVAFSAAKIAKTKLREQEPVEYRLVGEWARAELPDDARIACRKPEIAYYANRPMVPLPVVGDPAELAAFARRRGVSHVVLDRYAVWGTRPALRPLFDRDAPHPGFTLVHSLSVAGRPTLVYRVDPEVKPASGRERGGASQPEP